MLNPIDSLKKRLTALSAVSSVILLRVFEHFSFFLKKTKQQQQQKKNKASNERDFFACDVCGQAVPAAVSKFKRNLVFFLKKMYQYNFLIKWGDEQHCESLKPLVGLYARCKFCDRSFIEHRALMQVFISLGNYMK